MLPAFRSRLQKETYNKATKGKQADPRVWRLRLPSQQCASVRSIGFCGFGGSHRRPSPTQLLLPLIWADISCQKKTHKKKKKKQEKTPPNRITLEPAFLDFHHPGYLGHLGTFIWV